MQTTGINLATGQGAVYRPSSASGAAPQTEIGQRDGYTSSPVNLDEQRRQVLQDQAMASQIMEEIRAQSTAARLQREVILASTLQSIQRTMGVFGLEHLIAPTPSGQDRPQGGQVGPGSSNNPKTLMMTDWSTPPGQS